MSKYKRNIEYANKERQSAQSVMEQILKEGAQRLLQEKVLHEVEENIDMHSDKKDGEGKRMVVKNILFLLKDTSASIDFWQTQDKAEVYFKLLK